MSAHDIGKAEAEKEVLRHWKNVAALARVAGLHELADHADHHANMIENPPAKESE